MKKINYIALARDEQKEKLTESIKQGIVETGLAAFGPGMSPEEILEHVLPVDQLYIACIDAAVVGFATVNLTKHHVDLVGAAVHPSAQGLWRL